MRRVVSVWLPDWPITRRFGTLRTPPPEGPFALVERTPRGLVIQAANRAARAVGARIGQTHADARALCPGLESAAADPAEDRRALERLALWCERFSPSVAVDQVGPRLDGLTLDVTGAAHLFGGEAALVAEIEGRLRAAGVPCRAALADTPGAAWALARFGPPDAPRVIPPGGGRGALTELPVEALRLAEPTLVLLKRFGLRRIGDLYALPRAGLARRFRGGEALEVVRRLDQALGVEAEALRTVRPAPVYRVWRNFAEPILIVEGVEARLPELVEALAAQLARDGRGARRLALTAFRVDGRTTAVEAGFSQPAHRPAHLTRVLRDAGLERLDLGFGADALMLSAPAADPVEAKQNALEEEDVRGDLSALVDRLQARLGAEAVRRPLPRERWAPEHSEVLVPADATPGHPSRSRDGPSPEGAAGGRFRPFLLLDPPEPAENVVAVTPDYPPRGFTWRRVRHRVATAQGPERLSPEWWRTGLPPADEAAERPVLKVAREDVEHVARQGSRKVSKPGVCVPALPNATGLEGRRPALSLVPAVEAVPPGRTLDGYPPPPPSFPLDGGRWPRGAGSDGGDVREADAPSARRAASGDDTPIRRGSAPPPSPIKGEGSEDLPRTRDYFLVEDEEGARFWLFREGLFGREPGAPVWWVHGVG